MSSSGGTSSWLMKTLAKGSACQTELPTQDGLELTFQRFTVAQPDSSAESGLETPQHTQPLLIPSKGHAAQLTSSGSAGLPSALALPPAPPVPEQQVLTVQQLSSSGQQEQQHVLQRPGSDGSSAKGPKGVRWLPGLQAAPESSSHPSDDVAPGAATVQHHNCNTCGPAGEDGDASNQAQPQELYTTSSSSRTMPLPSSNDPQLDKYLRYLLQEQHPHKFLYYEAYGMTVDGELPPEPSCQRGCKRPTMDSFSPVGLFACCVETPTTCSVLTMVSALQEVNHAAGVLSWIQDEAEGCQ